MLNIPTKKKEASMGAFLGAAGLGAGLGGAGTVAKQLVSGEKLDANEALRNALLGGSLVGGLNLGVQGGMKILGSKANIPEGAKALGALGVTGLTAAGGYKGMQHLLNQNAANPAAEGVMKRASFETEFNRGLKEAATKIAAHYNLTTDEVLAELEEKVAFMGGALQATKAFGKNLMGGAQALGNTAKNIGGVGKDIYQNLRGAGQTIGQSAQGAFKGMGNNLRSGWQSMAPGQQAALRNTGLVAAGGAAGAAGHAGSKALSPESVTPRMSMRGLFGL